MRPPNYRQAKKQKEQKRKLRQDDKQQRRSTRVQTDDGQPPQEGTQPTAPLTSADGK